MGGTVVARKEESRPGGTAWSARRRVRRALANDDDAGGGGESVHHVRHSPGPVPIRQRRRAIGWLHVCTNVWTTCVFLCGNGGRRPRSGDKREMSGDNPVNSKIPLDQGERDVHPGVTPSGDAAQRPAGRPGGNLRTAGGSTEALTIRTVGRSICDRSDGLVRTRPEGRWRPGGRRGDRRHTGVGGPERATAAGTRRGSDRRSGRPRRRDDLMELAVSGRGRFAGPDRGHGQSAARGRPGRPGRADVDADRQ